MKMLKRLVLGVIIGGISLLSAGDMGWYLSPKCLNINDYGLYSPNDFVAKWSCKALPGDKKYLFMMNKLGYLQYKCFIDGKTNYFIVLHTTIDECKRLSQALKK